MAATLRPETMYGQTNAWALPDGDYAAYRCALFTPCFELSQRCAWLWHHTCRQSQRTHACRQQR